VKISSIYNDLFLSYSKIKKSILSFQRGAEIKNRSIITTPKSDDRQKNKKKIKKNTHHCKINTFITP
jgi:hypothetical protein